MLASPNNWLRGTRTSRKEEDTEKKRNREEEVIVYFSLISRACYLPIYRLPSNIMIQKIFAITKLGSACPPKADHIKQGYSLWCEVLY